MKDGSSTGAVLLVVPADATAGLALVKRRWRLEVGACQTACCMKKL
jgi:hypothetical protein